MADQKPSYYGIIPANVRYDRSLTPNAKLLFSEITVMTKKEGYCWASNNYFADVFSVSPQAISKWIKALSDKGYISIEYERKGNQIMRRKIYPEVSTKVDRVSTKVDEGINKSLIGYQQKFKENNTSINNTSMNNTSKSVRFVPPTVEEVRAYCNERKNGIDPEHFIAHYEANGWKVGRNPMKSWRSSVITWEKNEKSFGKSSADFDELKERRRKKALENVLREMEERKRNG